MQLEEKDGEKQESLQSHLDALERVQTWLASLPTGGGKKYVHRQPFACSFAEYNSLAYSTSDKNWPSIQGHYG